MDFKVLLNTSEYDFLRTNPRLEECARQKQISDAAPDDHRRDYAELNEAFRGLLNSMQ